MFHELPTSRPQASPIAAVAVGLLLLAGCAAPSLPTPIVYGLRDPSPADTVPLARQTPTVEIVYVTDRVPAEATHQRYLHYTSGRSKSKAAGVATVDLGASSWEQLVERRKLARPSVIEVREVTRFSPTPIPLVEIDGAFVPDPERVAANEASVRELWALLEEQMLPEDEGRLTVFVHGFNVDFEHAVITAAEISELLGRRGLVIAYSWPAGSGSLLRGYTHDRESGEFSVLHLRRTLRQIAAAQSVRQVNLIAHSRGTDVLTTALREINLEEQAAGRSTRETLKLGHVILAAPDLDLEVVSQRIASEYLHMAPISTTIYFSPRDRALGIANWLFNGLTRLGGIDFDKLDEETRRAIADAPPEIELIDVRSETHGLGHSYFHQSPEVSSDLYLILVEDRRIGARNGRPVRRIEGGVWRIDAGYPATALGEGKDVELIPLTPTDAEGASAPGIWR